MRKYKTRKQEMIETYIKNGRYTYSNDKLYDNKLKEDVSDLLEGIKMNENVKVKENEPEIKKKINIEPIKEDKEIMPETKTETMDFSALPYNEYDKDLFISDDYVIMVSFAQAHPEFIDGSTFDNNLSHYKFGKYFKEMIKPEHFLRLNYEPTNDSFSILKFEYLRATIKFFKEYSTKNKSEIDKLTIYVKHYYPVAILCTFDVAKIMVIIAQRGDDFY